MKRARGTRGSVSLMVVIMMPALLVAGGLVLDGGRQLQTRRDAGAAAAAASRAAAQLSEAEIFGDRLDAGLAQQRGYTELEVQGMSGTVAVSGQSVTVTVTASVDYLLLPGSGTVSESSTSDPSSGVQTGSVTP